MKKEKLVLLLWFAGITSFFLVLSSIFISLIPSVNHRIVVLYEPNELIFWVEIILMVYVISITLWIAYNYISGRGLLTITRK